MNGREKYEKHVAAQRSPYMWLRWDKLSKEIQAFWNGKKQAKSKAAPAPKKKAPRKKAAKKAS